MTRRHNAAHHADQAVGPRQGPARSFVISYRGLTMGLLFFVALAFVIRLGFSLREPQAPLTGSDPARRTALVAHGAPEQGASKELSAPPTRVIPVAAASDGDELEGGVIDPVNALRRLNDVLAHAEPRERAVADALKRFAATGAMSELRALDRSDVLALATRLSSQLSPQELTGLLRQFLGFSGETGLTGETASASLVGIFDALAGNRVEEVRPSVVMVTDGADADGRITGRAHVLPAGTERVYAVFENDHALEGLDQVLAVWRDPNDDRMVFTEFESVRRGSAYNYVWLEVESGWPEGRYQVELFHPEAQSLLLASESFSVR